MMIEYGEQFWGDRWPALYDVLGGNPLAAMPSLHFATSLMGAHLLSEVGPVAGAVGWTYAALLGLALVYLGEHYAVDLVGGAALAETVRRGAPRAAPLARRVVRGLAGAPANSRRPDRSDGTRCTTRPRSSQRGAVLPSQVPSDQTCGCAMAT